MINFLLKLKNFLRTLNKRNAYMMWLKVKEELKILCIFIFENLPQIIALITLFKKK